MVLFAVQSTIVSDNGPFCRSTMGRQWSFVESPSPLIVVVVVVVVVVDLAADTVALADTFGTIAGAVFLVKSGTSST
jgi:hypothetical protein